MKAADLSKFLASSYNKQNSVIDNAGKFLDRNARVASSLSSNFNAMSQNNRHGIECRSYVRLGC